MKAGGWRYLKKRPVVTFAVTRTIGSPIWTLDPTLPLFIIKAELTPAPRAIPRGLDQPFALP
jgi:hypothetical protein